MEGSPVPIGSARVHLEHRIAPARQKLNKGSYPVFAREKTRSGFGTTTSGSFFPGDPGGIVRNPWMASPSRARKENGVFLPMSDAFIQGAASKSVRSLRVLLSRRK
jgi:hypothetical protein